LSVLNELSMGYWITLSVIAGLCIGSFLNVVAYRLPKMMEAQWAAELAEANEQPAPEKIRFNLSYPNSHCPHCNNQLKTIHNIPVLSFLCLNGKCGFCKAAISWRYPSVEISCALLFGGVAWLHTPSLTAIALMGFCATLLVLALIDLDTYLLPDDLTLPLVWAGLMVNMTFRYIPLDQAVMGAASGYLMLWAIYKLFKKFTGKEGMGYGDFKLLAAIGAWHGIMSLFTVVFVASVSGIFFGLGIQWLRGKNHTEPFPFGPCLVLGAFTWMAGLDISKWL